MSEVWAFLVGMIILLIMYGIISSNLRQRRVKKISERLLPHIPEMLDTVKAYRVVLTSGSSWEGVRFLGLTTRPTDYEFGSFATQQWLVLGKPDGKRVFVKPTLVKYFEEI